MRLLMLMLLRRHLLLRCANAADRWRSTSNAADAAVNVRQSAWPAQVGGDGSRHALRGIVDHMDNVVDGEEPDGRHRPAAARHIASRKQVKLRRRLSYAVAGRKTSMVVFFEKRPDNGYM